MSFSAILWVEPIVQVKRVKFRDHHLNRSRWNRFHTRPSEAAFSTVFWTSMFCQPERANDVISGRAVQFSTSVWPYALNLVILGQTVLQIGPIWLPHFVTDDDAGHHIKPKHHAAQNWNIWITLSKTVNLFEIDWTIIEKSRPENDPKLTRLCDLLPSRSRLWCNFRSNCKDYRGLSCSKLWSC